MLPHARDEVQALADNCAVVSLESNNGWDVEQWHLTDDDVTRAVAAYQAILSISLDDELDALLVELEIDRLGPPPVTKQHAKVARADAIELVAAATVVSVEQTHLDNLYMPNVPKMSEAKSDSGIDVIGVELDPTTTGPIVAGERLILVSVKHTIQKHASGMRDLLEKSVDDDLTLAYLYRQLITVNGRMKEQGLGEGANRVMHFLGQVGTPNVRIVCVGAASPTPACNLDDQPSLLSPSNKPDAHFRMLFVPGLETLHDQLVPK
ncbi:hypothetical protein ACIO3S_17335 [Nocardioides sp. NPDC087217]|uniref:hypothetical protein n=1 Tax=Nocardioides sp. NPDC087217 TaxID=3364335 RepID=UPI003808AAB9